MTAEKGRGSSPGKPGYAGNPDRKEGDGAGSKKPAEKTPQGKQKARYPAPRAEKDPRDLPGSRPQMDPQAAEDFGTGQGKEDPKEPDEIGKKQRIEVLKKFTQEALKKHGALIRSIVLFGSTARGSFRGESDIDIFVILDDTRVRITPGYRDQIEDDLDQIARKTSKHLSLQQPYLLTEFWRLVREGHPIVFNFIREGIPVYDKDIFLPIKRLLQMGEIRPSKEAVEKFIERAPQRIKRVESAKMYMVVEDLYYAMLESAQAVLMFLGKTPPRPSDAARELRASLVEMKFMEEKYAKDLEDVIELRKEVEHKRINDIAGAEIDEWIKRSKEFVKKMQGLIVKIEVLKRESMIEKSYAIMAETAATLLKAMNRLPEKPEELPKAFEENLVKPGLLSDKYMEVFTSLSKMRAMVRQGKVLDLQKQEILAHREYVRKFIREAGRVLRKKVKVEGEAEAL